MSRISQGDVIGRWRFQRHCIAVEGLQTHDGAIAALESHNGVKGSDS
jgi:hypothetical protein